MKKWISSIIVLLLAGTLFAEGAPESEKAEPVTMTINIEQAVTMAMQNNLSVKQAERSLKALERSDKNSWNSVSPSISASSQLQIPLMESMGSKAPSYSVGASMSLRFTPALFTSINSARIQLEQGQITYEEALRSVELNVRKIFYSIILAEENLNIQKRSMETAKRQYETNQIKYNRGQLSELDLLQSQVNYEGKRPAIESQENQLVNNMENFKQLLGVDRSVHLLIEGDLSGFENFDEEKLEVQISELNSIKKLEKQVEAAENSLLATKYTAWGPSVSAAYSIGAGGKIEKGSKFGLTNHSISLGVSIPLDGYLPWSSGALSIENQKESLETQKENLENQKTTLQLSIENSLRSIRQAKNQMKSLEANVELAQKTYDLTETAYNHGSRDLNTLKNAEDSLVSAKAQLQSQSYTLVTAILELESTLGLPFGSLIKQEK